MLDALSAETLKITRHKATWFLVWLYPVLFLAIYLIAIAIAVSRIDHPAKVVSAAAWISETDLIWKLPNQTIGRFLIAAYVAVVFAGEYGWNTWKLIIPHRRRASLLAAKFAAVALLLVAALAMTAIIAVLFTWLDGIVTGRPAPAGVTAGAILLAHGETALAGLAPFLFTIASIALAAVLTRSTIAALVIGIVVATLEQVFVAFGPALATYAPGLVRALYQALPGYHLVNLAAWIGDGAARSVAFPDGRVVALDWTVSLAVAAAWTIGLTAATFAAFKRQDIN